MGFLFSVEIIKEWKLYVVLTKVTLEDDLSLLGQVNQSNIEYMFVVKEKMWDLTSIGEENEALFIRVWKLLSNTCVLKLWGKA